MSPVQDIGPKRLGELSKVFLDTEYGEYVIAKLSELYNDEHHAAETATTIEQKAMKVERAAGIKIAMDLLLSNAALLDIGYFDEAKPMKQ